MALKKRKQKNESVNQDRSHNARQGAESNSTWRRSLTGAAKHCFDSKDPCGSVWRFSEKQILDALQYASSSFDRSLLLATGNLLISSFLSRITCDRPKAGSSQRISLKRLSLEGKSADLTIPLRRILAHSRLPARIAVQRRDYRTFSR